MHLFRTAPLVEQLGRRAVSAEERAKYLLAGFLVFNFAYYSGYVIGTAPPWTVPGTIEAIAVILINIMGIVKTFDASGGRDNPDFVVEFTCLYVPVSVTTLLGVWGTYWFLRTAFRESIMALSESHFQFAVNLSSIDTNLFGFLTFAATIGVLIITYSRIAGLLVRVQEAKSAG